MYGLKIDWQHFFKDYMVFGVYYLGHHRVISSANEIGKSGFYYSQWWTLRLWPCLKDGEILPNWYMAIWDFFGYAKDYEEGIE